MCRNPNHRRLCATHASNEKHHKSCTGNLIREKNIQLAIAM